MTAKMDKATALARGWQWPVKEAVPTDTRNPNNTHSVEIDWRIWFATVGSVLLCNCGATIRCAACLKSEERDFLVWREQERLRAQAQERARVDAAKEQVRAIILDGKAGRRHLIQWAKNGSHRQQAVDMLCRMGIMNLASGEEIATFILSLV
jgi:hypothetical protein